MKSIVFKERLTVLIDFLNDLIQLLSCRVLAQHPHHGTQLLGADVTAAVGVKHVEGRLEFWKNLSRQNVARSLKCIIPLWNS